MAEIQYNDNYSPGDFLYYSRAIAPFPFSHSLAKFRFGCCREFLLVATNKLRFLVQFISLLELNLHMFLSRQNSVLGFTVLSSSVLTLCTTSPLVSVLVKFLLVL